MTPDDPEALAATTPGAMATTTLDENETSRTAGAPVVLPRPGYDIGEVIGRGGMGEVVTAHDRRIGRDVAIKRMRGATPSANATDRFLREARIQARLDHPAIVPVHELGVDDSGRPFFTMKRLAGVTLADKLTAGGPLQPLLRAFVDVCLAIEFAHQRGVVHRDLKPANIMLGDFGEVYVLDWGIARVLTDRGRAATAPSDIVTLDEGTKAGELLGTPGFMSPEQVQGHEVAPPSDVYALGAILFEILTGEGLHPRGAAALASTLGAPQQAPAQRTPDRDLPPELDAACFAALAEDPAARPTSRALAERLQKYLDGDRDVEARRVLAAQQLVLAREAFDSGDPERRSAAMKLAGRALALDQSSTEAAKLVSSLIVKPPKVLPVELVADLAEDERRMSVDRIRTAVVSVMGAASCLLLLPVLQVRNWTTLGVAVGSLVVILLLLWRAQRLGRPNPWINLATGFVLSVAFTRVIGPFTLTPVVIAGAVLAITANQWTNARPQLVALWLLAVIALPQLLEATGVFATTWKMIDGGVCQVSAMFHGQSWIDGISLHVTNTLLLAALAVYGIRSARNASEARKAVRIQAWHLGHMLPSGPVNVR